MNIIEPFNGAVLNHLDGQETNDSLTITVRGRAHLEDRVLVNGQLAQRSGTELQPRWFCGRRSLKSSPLSIPSAAGASSASAWCGIRQAIAATACASMTMFFASVILQ